MGWIDDDERAGFHVEAGPRRIQIFQIMGEVDREIRGDPIAWMGAVGRLRVPGG